MDILREIKKRDQIKSRNISQLIEILENIEDDFLEAVALDQINNDFSYCSMSRFILCKVIVKNGYNLKSEWFRGECVTIKIFLTKFCEKYKFNLDELYLIRTTRENLIRIHNERKPPEGG